MGALHAVNREALSIVRRIVYIVAGFLGGVIVSRNAAAMPRPSANAVLVGAGVLCVVGWIAGRREKNSAVAIAVAHAEATATAVAESQAAAFAQAAVHLHMTTGPVGLVEAGQAERPSLDLTAGPWWAGVEGSQVPSLSVGREVGSVEDDRVLVRRHVSGRDRR